MRPLRLLLLAALLAACTPEAADNENPTGERICTPRNIVFCVCSNGSHGTKQCASTGRSFGPCIGCDGSSLPEGCAPGSEEPCLCDNGTEGIHTCQDDGISFDACTQCGQGNSGASGSAGSDSFDNEACPGAEISVSAGEEVDREGTTEGALDDYASCGQPGPDVVYQIVPDSAGTLTVSVKGEGPMDPVLHAWNDDCMATADTDVCVDSSGSGSTEEMTFPVTGGQPVYVVVDSNGEGGAFLLTASLDGSSSGDQCPGVPVAMAAGAAKTLSGSTKSAKSDFAGSAACSGAKAGDVVYAVQAAAAGQLTARVTPVGSYDAVIYVRSGGCESGAQLACSNSASAGKAEEVSFAVTPGQLYNVFIDGTTTGDFDLELELSSKVCGDFDVVAPEQCDDGNKEAGDGCSPTCRVEENPLDVTCPGVTVHVFNEAIVLTGTTEGYDPLQQGDCGGAISPDRVYRVVPGKSGKLEVAIDASFDSVIYARSEACTGTKAKETGCDDTEGPGGESLSLTVTAGTPLWLFVDGWDGDDQKGQQGEFELTLQIK